MTAALGALCPNAGDIHSTQVKEGVMANTFPALKNEYAALWQAIRIRPERMAEIQYIFGKLTNPASKARYKAVEVSTTVPWYVIAIIHNLEAGRRFDCHLHNGDPLTARTTHVPKNRPTTGSPPFTWEVSAKDALEFDGLTNVTPWTVERIAFELEKFNGFGYRNNHPNVKSPYLWSYSNIYTSGKYTADGTWSETAVSDQCGAMVMLRYMIDQGEITVATEGTAPTPDAVAGPPPTAPLFPGFYLRRGLENDQNVEIVQRRLREIGIDPGTIDGSYGLRTETAVKLFQARSADPSGAPLDVDGIVGPDTWTALFGSGTAPEPQIHPTPPTPPSSLVAAVIDVASGEVGVREQPLGSNRGPRVDEYIRNCGLDPTADSYPWCMCFVFFCYTQAALRTGVANIVPKNPSVHGAWNASQGKSGVTVVTTAAAQSDPSLVKPGMVFFIDTGHSHGHCGIVVANLNGLLETIEGNTNDNGTSEGIGVFRRTARRVSGINMGFASYG
jgi:lysozyme family protein/peptidoglycan hydrolase-like protein with peptidoglycan-binding domain